MYGLCVLVIDMRQLIIIPALIIVVLMDSSDGQYPDCVSCYYGRYIIISYTLTAIEDLYIYIILYSYIL